MGAMAIDEFHQIGSTPNYDNEDYLVEEIEGLIKVYKSGYVERSHVMSCVDTSLAAGLGVTAEDVFIDKVTNVWARIYVPNCYGDILINDKFPILVYFHGGGFCLGSSAWKCYHEFLGELSSQSRCLIMSVNYRLAPENPLPAAYEDGIKAIMWLKQQALSQSSECWWTSHCDLSSIFLGGDSAGANLAYNVALKLGTPQIGPLRPLKIRGIILIQPFFSGKERTNFEKIMVQPRRLALSLSISDTYWRLALPSGTNRDHPWCNPLGKNQRKLRGLKLMVCIAENDILRDRNLELCSILGDVGNEVKHLISEGVGHAFHILDRSPHSLIRRQEMISHIINFIM